MSAPPARTAKPTAPSLLRLGAGMKAQHKETTLPDHMRPLTRPDSAPSARGSAVFFRSAPSAHSNLWAYLPRTSHRSKPQAGARRPCILRKWARGSEGRSSGPARTGPQGPGPRALELLHSRALPLETPPDGSVSPSVGNRRAPFRAWGRSVASRGRPERPSIGCKGRAPSRASLRPRDPFQNFIVCRDGTGLKQVFSAATAEGIKCPAFIQLSVHLHTLL